MWLRQLATYYYVCHMAFYSAHLIMTSVSIDDSSLSLSYENSLSSWTTAWGISFIDFSTGIPIISSSIGLFASYILSCACPGILESYSLFPSSLHSEWFSQLEFERVKVWPWARLTEGLLSIIFLKLEILALANWILFLLLCLLNLNVPLLIFSFRFQISIYRTPISSQSLSLISFSALTFNSVAVTYSLSLSISSSYR